MTGITGSVVTKQLWTPARHNHPIPSPKKATTSSPGSKGAAPLSDGLVHPRTCLNGTQGSHRSGARRSSHVDGDSPRAKQPQNRRSGEKEGELPG